MMKLFLFLVFFITTLFAMGQFDYANVDKQAEFSPDSVTKCSDIALHITAGLSTDREKFRAIYFWISHNIKYDLSQLALNKRFGSSEELVLEVLSKRGGICQHYAELFHAMSLEVGLRSFVISGYVRQSDGEIAPQGHAWNGVFIDSSCYFVDATWAAGYLQNGKSIHKFRDSYFLISPQEFIKTHMPFDPIWQFLYNPLNNSEFITQNYIALTEPSDYNFRDSIEKHEQLSLVQKLEASNRRIIAIGVKNSLIQQQIDENQLQLANAQYNLAIDTLNYGVVNYNLYVLSKNRQFRKPKLDDAFIKESIDNAEKGLQAANNMLMYLFSDDETLNNMILETKKQLPELLNNVERERNFVQRYLKRWKPLRIFMFYAP